MSWDDYTGAQWQCTCGKWVPIGLRHWYIKLKPLPDPCTIADMDILSSVETDYEEMFQKPDSKVYRGDNR